MAEIIVSGKEGLKDLPAEEFATEIKNILKGSAFKGEKVKSIYYKNKELVIETCSL